MKTETIKISKNDWAKCHEFAVAQLETSINHYKKRKQGNAAKITEDIITGKLGELAAYRFLRSKGIMCAAPDFNIYEARQKSFDADLNFEGKQFHCKSQSRMSAAKYGESWILQWGGKGHGHIDKLFKNRSKNDYLVPMQVSETEVIIYGIIPVDTLFKNDLIKEPKLAWFADTKRAVYLNDIRKLNHYFRWGLVR